jgi:hypothetical protein
MELRGRKLPKVREPSEQRQLFRVHPPDRSKRERRQFDRQRRDTTRPGARFTRRNFPTHKRPTRLHGLEIPLGDELPVSGEHRVPMDAEGAAELTTRRQLGAGREGTALNLADNAAHEPLREGESSGAAEVEGELGGHLVYPVSRIWYFSIDQFGIKSCPGRLLCEKS